MPTDKNEDKRKVTRLAIKRATEGATWWKENWDLCEDDLRNLNGDQWPAGIKTERESDQRPCLVNNVLPTFVDQVIGDQRQNSPSIKVSARSPVTVPGSDGDDLKIKNLTGAKEYTIAEVMNGAIKDIEYSCDADTSYDVSFQSAVESGIGFLRVRTDWEDEGWTQNFIIDHIENQFSVTMDPGAKERDYSDMRWCFIDENMPKEQFEELYPDASTEPIDDKSDDMSGWFAENTVRVSEYFTREPCEKELLLLSDGRSVYMEDVESILDELNEEGITIKRRRKVKSYKVMWRKITGCDVLEGPEETPFETIPVIPVFGKCLTIKKRRVYRSIIRYSKDAQRMSNYWDSAMAEAVALAPKAPFSGTPEQIEGFEDEWETANTKNHGMLRFNKQHPTDPGPQRNQPAMVPTAELALGQSSVDKIKSTLGMFDASIGAQGNETSGKAIIARQRQGDRGSFVYLDNLSKSITRVGQLIVNAIPKTWDTEKDARLRFEDGSVDYVKLNEQVFDEESGEWVTINDLGVTKYDVAVSTGPSYATQRIEAAEAMIQFAQAVPSAAAVIADLIALNMDWPGADTISDRLKKIIPPNVLTNEEREKIAEDAPEPPPPSPEEQAQMAEIEVRMAEVEVKKIEAEADVTKAQADVKKAEADTMKAEADMIQAQLQTQEAQTQMSIIEEQANNGNMAYQQVRELVAQAIAELSGGQSTTPQM